MSSFKFLPLDILFLGCSLATVIITILLLFGTPHWASGIALFLALLYPVHFIARVFIAEKKLEPKSDSSVS